MGRDVQGGAWRGMEGHGGAWRGREGKGVRGGDDGQGGSG